MTLSSRLLAQSARQRTARPAQTPAGVRAEALCRQHLVKGAGGKCWMVAELHAGDGAARLCAIEPRRRIEAGAGGVRTAVGEAAALADENGAALVGFVLLHEPVAHYVGTRDRRD